MGNFRGLLCNSQYWRLFSELPDACLELVLSPSWQIKSFFQQIASEGKLTHASAGWFPLGALDYGNWYSAKHGSDSLLTNSSRNLVFGAETSSFLHHVMLTTEHLPRQARDKDRKS